jgi:hypothetical protein
VVVFVVIQEAIYLWWSKSVRDKRISSLHKNAVQVLETTSLRRLIPLFTIPLLTNKSTRLTAPFGCICGVFLLGYAIHAASRQLIISALSALPHTAAKKLISKRSTNPKRFDQSDLVDNHTLLGRSLLGYSSQTVPAEQ